jgi:hypothetical protein
VNTPELDDVHGVNQRRTRLLEEELKEKESPASLLPIDEETVVPVDSPIGDSLSDGLIEQAEAVLESAFAAEESKAVLSTLTPEPPAQRPTEDPKPPRERNPLQEAVCYAFDVRPGSMAGKIGKFFSAGFERTGRKSANDWARYQPDTPVSSQQIIAFTLWYSKIPKYASSYAERKSLPMTPTILRERWDEYAERGADVHAYWMDQAKPVFERLMRGEKVQPKPGVSQQRTAPVESAQGYKPFDHTHDTAYQDRTEGVTPELLSELFGA